MGPVGRVPPAATVDLLATLPTLEAKLDLIRVRTAALPLSAVEVASLVTQVMVVRVT